MMTVSFEIEGEHKDISRVILPYHSVNVAMAGDGSGEFGFPTRNLIEINGPVSGIGKSTLATDWASRISQALDDAPIAYLDLEGQSESTIYNTLKNSGYKAKTFKWVNGKSDKKDDNTDEKLLGRLEDTLWDKTTHIAILDSVAAISPVSETEGDIGDANMGRRSFSMAQFTRRIVRALRTVDTPTVVFLLNHQYEKIGAIGFAKQYESPGGNVKKFLEKTTIQIKVPWVDYIGDGAKKEARWKESGAWVLEGTVNKNRSGTKDRTFQVFVYGGWGVHVGMSALIDCLATGLAKVKAGKVVMNDQDFGNLKKIIDNKRDEPDFFLPFINELRVPTNAESDEGDDDE